MAQLSALLESAGFHPTRLKCLNILPFASKNCDMIQFDLINSIKRDLYPFHICEYKYSDTNESDWLQIFRTKCQVVDYNCSTDNFVFYFEYSTQFERFFFKPDINKLNPKNEIQNMLLTKYYEDRVTKENECDWFMSNVVQHSSFIPVVINADDGCCISYGKRKVPCLGKNIRKHPNIMQGLSPWLRAGGKIENNKMYVIRSNSQLQLYCKEFKR